MCMHKCTICIPFSFTPNNEFLHIPISPMAEIRWKVITVPEVWDHT